ncbi:MAG: DeoR/GlpR family DNA-binding transcription regulator [Eubacteriales bacterium]|nr:DeoR/GlpR family DNA-binding transcription regulator [Eubacteriales bacterium]
MLPAQRITLIKDILLDKKSIDTSTLSNYLEVSEVTIRKYFDQLEKEGFLKKVHGGAVLNTDAPLPASISEDDSFSHNEVSIALAASDLIENGDSIFIGSGILCYALATHLHAKKDLSIVTTNINAIPHLQKFASNVYLLGGDVRSDSDGFLYSCGSNCLHQLSRIYVSKAFFSVDAIDIHAGITTNELFDIDLLKTISQITTQPVVLVSSSTFDKIALHRFGTLQSFDTYITDTQIPNKYKNHFYSNNIKLISAYNI